MLNARTARRSGPCQQDSAVRSNGRLTRKRGAGDRAALAAAGVPGAGAAAAQEMRATSARAGAAAAAAREFRFCSLPAERRRARATRASSRSRAAAERRPPQKIRAKAEQLQQSGNRPVPAAVATGCDSAVGDQDASLEPRARRSDAQAARSQLAALDAKEAVQTRRAAQRRRGDDGGLSRPSCGAKTDSSRSARKSATIQTQTRAQDRGASQRGRRAASQPRPPVAAGQPAARRCRRKLVQIHKQFTAQFQADVANDGRRVTTAPRPTSTGSSPPCTVPTSAQPAPPPKNSTRCRSVATTSTKQIVDQITREADAHCQGSGIQHSLR